MSALDTRSETRDSLFMLADVRLEGASESTRVRVRNLSAGGMMAEGVLPVMRGTALSVQMNNIGWVDGTVAWVQGNRCGIAFAQEIDPKLARSPVQSARPGADTAPAYLRGQGARLGGSAMRKL